MTEFQAYEFTAVDSDAAWAAEPTLRRVRAHYEGVAWWRRVYKSNDNLKGTVPFNLAAIARAAEHQGRRRAEAVLTRLREERRTIASVDDALAAVADVPGLDVWRLVRDLDSHAVRWSIEADRKLARRHEAIPTLLLRGPRGDRIVSGPADFEAYVRAVEAVSLRLEAVA